MAEVVNLRARRKTVAKDAARAEADENAVKFGRSKGQKLREAADIARTIAALDGKRFEKDDPV